LYNQEYIEIFKETYITIKKRIDERISFFKELYRNATDEDIFLELAFCILTPQSKARSAEKAINRLKKENQIYSNDISILSDIFNIVRFKNNKAKYYIMARELFSNNGKNGEIEIKKHINEKDILSTRDFLVKNIVGFGYKEGSHFLRNIGFGEELAILDRHILKNLHFANVINEVPRSITPKVYMEIEKKMLDFSNYIGIALDSLDFVLWYKEANDIFK